MVRDKAFWEEVGKKAGKIAVERMGDQIRKAFEQWKEANKEHIIEYKRS